MTGAPEQPQAVLLLPRADLEEMLTAAARLGAQQALASIGLHDDTAAADVRELRGVLDAWRTIRRGALQQLGRVATAVVLALIFAAVGGGALRKIFPSE